MKGTVLQTHIKDDMQRWINNNLHNLRLLWQLFTGGNDLDSCRNAGRWLDNT